MTKIGILTASKVSLPAMMYLLQSNIQISLIIPNKVNDDLNDIEGFALHYKIPFEKWSKKELVDKLPTWIALNQLNAVFVKSFPFIFPPSLIWQITIPFLNFHYAPLPKYAGAHPFFWMIRNNEKLGGIHVHQISERVDSGDILHQEKYQISNNETFGTYQSGVAQLGIKATVEVIQKINQPSWSSLLIPQLNGLVHQNCKKPELEDVKINWETMKAKDIIQLCRACNPWNKGAITFLLGQMFKLIELSIVDSVKHNSEAPGTIVIKTKEQRIYISTTDKKYLSIQIASLEDGFYSSVELLKRGLSTGMRFQT